EIARFEELLPQYKAAPDVTRSRIYIETMQEVYSSTSKILVDTKGSGNMLYLPLDKILERQGTTTSPSTNRSTLEGLRNQDGGVSTENSTVTSRSNSRTGRN
ncbi:MAG: protease modulator HflK, partial [Paraglaciecola sp.]|nr:protease modulator HflK [Paraglaciecola sp.]